jgi:hypothetical protein
MIGDAEGRITELHSFTCGHCGNPKTVPEGKKVEDVSDICRCCWRLHCLDPACCAGCVPFARKVDEMEARHRFRASAGLT